MQAADTDEAPHSAGQSTPLFDSADAWVIGLVHHGDEARDAGQPEQQDAALGLS